MQVCPQPAESLYPFLTFGAFGPRTKDETDVNVEESAIFGHLDSAHSRLAAKEIS